MEVKVINPHSFCYGVATAIDVAKKAINDNKGKTVYLLGSLVHNEIVMNELENMGLVLISEKNNDLLSSLESLPDESIVVFSAHGHPSAFDSKAKEKNMKIYDATCSFVVENMNLINECLSKGCDVIYIGKKGHLECEAATSLSADHIHLFDPSEKKPPEIDPTRKNVVIPQTTMSPMEIESAKQILRDNEIEFECIDHRCVSTKMRQDSIREIPDDIDLIVILGSKTSNNTQELYNLANDLYGSKKQIVTALDANELSTLDLSGCKKAALASGASTSPQTFDEALNFLKAR